MAYAFSAIENLVDENDPNKQSIFGAQQMGQVDNNQQQQQPPPGSDMVKVSTEGDIGQSQQGSDDTVKHKAPTPSDQSRVISANVGKTSTPAGVGRISDRIAQNQQTLQDRADAYTQQYRDQYQYDISDQDMNLAIEDSSSDAYRNVADLRGRRQAEYRPEFEGADDLQVNQVDYLNSQAGLQKLAAEGQGPRYTQGMGAFDVMLMQRDPAFTKLVSEIRGKNTEFEKTLNERPDVLETEAQTYGDEALSSAKSRADQFLNRYQTDLQAANEREADAYEAQRAQLDRDQVRNEAMQAARDRTSADLVQMYGDRVLPQFEATNVDINPYLNFDETDYNYRDFLDAGEANRFNNIMALLGQGGQSYTESSGPGPQYTVDQSGLMNDIYTQANLARQEADRVGIQERDAMLRAAQTRADADDQRRLALMSTYDQRLNDLTNRVVGDAGDLGQYFSENMLTEYQRPEAMDLSGSDVLNTQEVERLNALSRDLGLSDIYSQGQYSSGGPERLLNEANYRNYLINRMRQARDAVGSSANDGGIAPTLPGQLQINRQNAGTVMPSGSRYSEPENIYTGSGGSREFDTQRGLI